MRRRAVYRLVALLGILGATSCLSQERTREGDPAALARTEATNVGEFVQETRDLLAQLADSDEMTGDDVEACRTYARDQDQQQDDYTTFARADTDGVLDCSSEESTDKVQIEDRLYFKRVLDTKDFSVGEFQNNRITGAKTIVFADGALDDDDEVTHVVLVTVELDKLEDRLAAADLPQDASLTILDGAGTILARPDSDGKYTGDKPDDFAELASDPPEGGDAGTFEDVDGVEREFGVATVEGLPEDQPLYVVVGVATD